MLSSILFQDLSEKTASFESVTQHEGFIHMPDDLNEHSLEEEELVGGEGEEDALNHEKNGPSESDVVSGVARNGNENEAPTEDMLW